MKLTFKIFLLFLPVLAWAQMPGQRSAANHLLGEPRNTARSTTNTFQFCDTDSDGLLSINLESIQSQVLDENVNQFGTQEGIYISTRLAKVHLVTNMDNTPQCQFICNGSAGLGGYGMLDIAINQEGDMYVAATDKIYKLNPTSCAVQNTIDLGLNGNAITSLSFDRNHNIYLGGFDAKVYRMPNGSYGTMNPWHDFGQGAAAGDFVMCRDKMYIAWKINGGCRLYEVTVDSNTNYISHVDLGSLPDNTFGLASELGKLYGVTPFQLYKIDTQQPMAFTAVLNNPNASDDWYGAAGKNEAVDFEIKVFETAQNAHDNTNPLPSQWTNTVPFGQTVYVVIRNLVNNQIVTIPVQLVINAAPGYNDPVQIVHCENDPNANQFDLGALRTAIIGLQPNVQLSYHSSLMHAQNNTGPIPDWYTTSSNTNVGVRLTNTVTGCFSVFQFALQVAPKPDFNQPKDMIICTAHTGSVQLDSQIPQILNGQDSEDIEITFHHSMNDAENDANPLAVPYPMTSGVKEIFVRIENTYSGCFRDRQFLGQGIGRKQQFPGTICSSYRGLVLRQQCHRSRGHGQLRIFTRWNPLPGQSLFWRFADGRIRVACARQRQLQQIAQGRIPAHVSEIFHAQWRRLPRYLEHYPKFDRT
ncbi:hypothetical protein [Flavobacterium sp.]|uniref:hypothetical protein n=1 Tax=Flavobacterium sp. TaxID=239 RepID=UPI0039E3CDC3